MTELKEGTKYDDGKPRHDLVDVDFIEGIAAVLTYGAVKYEAHNWRKGILYSRCFSAMLRHVWSFWRGEKLDKETGLPHLHHAGCCLMFLCGYEAKRRKYRSFDDRYK